MIVFDEYLTTRCFECWYSHSHPARLYHRSTDTCGPKQIPQDNKNKCTSHHNYNQYTVGPATLPALWSSLGRRSFAILSTVTTLGVLFETLTAPHKKFWEFMQPEGSLPCPQEPVTCLQPQPDQSIQRPPIPCFESPVLHLPIPAYVFQVVSFLEILQPKSC